MLSEDGLLSTRRPERLWVARHPNDMKYSDFVPSPRFAEPGCPSPFEVLYTSPGTYAQALRKGRTIAGVLPLPSDGLSDSSEWSPQNASAYYGWLGGFWYFGQFRQSVLPKGEAGQSLCIAKSTVSRVRLPERHVPPPTQ